MLATTSLAKPERAMALPVSLLRIHVRLCTPAEFPQDFHQQWAGPQLLEERLLARVTGTEFSDEGLGELTVQQLADARFARDWLPLGGH